MSIHLMKLKTLTLFFIFIINLIKLNFTYSSNCNTVANLPETMESLLPNYQILNKFHLFNLFFLDAENQNKITIKINEPSVFKFLITPYLSDVQVEIFLPSTNQKEVVEAFSDLPKSYLNFEVQQGELVLNFILKPVSEQKQNKECNFAHFALEILLENNADFKKRNSRVKKDLEKLEDFSSFFKSNFMKIENGENLPLSIEHQTLKLDLNELSYYRNFNTSVLSSFDLNIEDKERIIGQKKQNSNQEEQNQNLSKKYLINFNLFSDFLYGGSFYFALIREEDIAKGELIENKCLFDNKCILSDRAVKNNINLQTILTPGKYKVLLMNFLDQEKYLTLKKQLPEIPVSATLEVKTFSKDENRYNCPGRHLPAHLNFLKDKYLNDYLEFSGDIIMNTERLNDEITIYAEEDSLLRISAFANKGENLDIEVYHLGKTKNIFESILRKKGMMEKGPFNPLINILNKVFKKKDENDGELKQLSEHFGESDGMLLPLIKDNTYKITFSYTDSMINEGNDLKSCETYYAKISLAKVSYIKTKFPNIYGKNCNGANISARRNEINKILKDFMDINKSTSKEDKDSVGDIYDSFAHGFTSISRAFFDRNKPYEILYNGKFTVENEVNFSLEILSDFTTSFIAPIILPINISNNNNNKNEKDEEKKDDETTDFNSLLNHKHNKITFHENKIKLNLKKGKYRLILINGISQFFNTDDVKENSHLTNMVDIELLPKCMEFQIRLVAEKLFSERTKHWECITKHFEYIPSNLNNLLHLGSVNNENLKQKFSYFSKDLLVPIKKHSMKLKTGKEGYLLRLIYEYDNAEMENNSKENVDESNYGLIVNLVKGKKILKSAKSHIVEEDIKSFQKYITHFLKPNTEYEISFEFLDKNNLFDYYSSCRLFKLELNFLADSTIKNNNNNIENDCKESRPKIDEIAYERIIGISNSFFRYNSKSILQMFLSKNLIDYSRDAAKKKEDQKDLDLETSHPITSNIQFVFDPSANRAFQVEYEFEVRSALSRVTLFLENPYSSVVGISAKLFYLNTGVAEIIAIEDMEENGFFSIKGIQLEMGKYKIIYYSNNLVDSKKDLPVYKKNFKKICVNFSASILIENRPFDFFSKHVSDNYMSCPYSTFPTDLNQPGFLSRESGYTMNFSGKFRITPNEHKVKFRIRNTSLFKFNIKDINHNILSFVDLYKIKGNSKKK